LTFKAQSTSGNAEETFTLTFELIDPYECDANYQMPSISSPLTLYSNQDRTLALQNGGSGNCRYSYDISSAYAYPADLLTDTDPVFTMRNPYVNEFTSVDSDGSLIYDSSKYV
jgi:hypothetical protein